MATAILSNNNLAFKNGSTNLTTMTSTANTLTLSSATNSDRFSLKILQHHLSIVMLLLKVTLIRSQKD